MTMGIFNYLEATELYCDLIDNNLTPEKRQAKMIWRYLKESLTQEMVEGDGEYGYSSEEEIEETLNDYNKAASMLCQFGYPCPSEYSDDDYGILKFYV